MKIKSFSLIFHCKDSDWLNGACESSQCNHSDLAVGETLTAPEMELIEEGSESPLCRFAAGGVCLTETACRHSVRSVSPVGKKRSATDCEVWHECFLQSKVLGFQVKLWRCHEVLLLGPRHPPSLPSIYPSRGSFLFQFPTLYSPLPAALPSAHDVASEPPHLN